MGWRMDVRLLDAPAAQARKKELERLLAATRGDPSRAQERAALREQDAAVAARIAELREEAHRENTRRNFAGLGSPLHEAIVAKLDPTLVTELESDALFRFAEREKLAAERRELKAKKAAEEPAPEKLSPFKKPKMVPEVSVIHRRASSGAGDA